MKKNARRRISPNAGFFILLWIPSVLYRYALESFQDDVD